MKLQRILYDQCNTSYLYDDINEYLFLVSSKKATSPYGPLDLNPTSLDLEKEIWKNFIKECKNNDLGAEYLEVEIWFDWLREYCKKKDCLDVVCMSPSEPQLLRTLTDMALQLSNEWIKLEIRPNTQFLVSHEVFLEKREKPPVMETFYRWMRKETRILMDGDNPEWGKRNYDKENRKFDRKYVSDLPSRLEENAYPVSRTQALELLDYFIAHHLDEFGKLEDAMYAEDDEVHHSLLSTSMNFGLLTPWEVIARVEAADTAMNNKEWFIRQVLGRREYMYHRFWFYKDSLYNQNALKHTNSLPDRFRRPEKSPLEMFCVNHVLWTVKETAYSHHITRLMIIGNFCLLMGYNPHHVNKWFWEMYADAFERVVSPNVLGMSQFADGGNLATKPYISSANYVNKMSNYCKICKRMIPRYRCIEKLLNQRLFQNSFCRSSSKETKRLLLMNES